MLLPGLLQRRFSLLDDEDQTVEELDEDEELESLDRGDD
jgi:hypothetical protein